MSKTNLLDQQVESLLQSIRSHYGYQFSSYSKPALIQQIDSFIEQEHLTDIDQLSHCLITNVNLFERFICKITNGTTELFREPTSLLAVRHLVFPLLRNIPFVTIWHCGCSSGEEVYSTAILLAEANLLDRTQLIGTDINQEALHAARSGTFSKGSIDAAVPAYRAAGGSRDLSDYFTDVGSQCTIEAQIRKKVSFVRHDLVSDGPIGEVHVIFCRNVLIYFSSNVAEQICDALVNSLSPPGALCFGKYESTREFFENKKITSLSTEDNIYLAGLNE